MGMAIIIEKIQSHQQTQTTIRMYNFIWFSRAILAAFLVTQVCHGSSSFPSLAASEEHVRSLESPFSPAQIQVLHALSSQILAANGFNAPGQFDNLESMSPFGSEMAPNPHFHPQRVAKRNSELLNSLLGLPKNILRSGRK